MIEQREAAPHGDVLQQGKIERMLRHWMRAERFEWREFFILSILGVIANLYFLSVFSLSIDDELAAVRADPGVWIAQGRFGVYLVERLLFPQPAVPFSPYLFLIVCLALSYMLLVRAHGIGVSWKTYASYPLFVTFPSWWLISEFSANVPSTGLGFLLVTLAAYLAGRSRLPASAWPGAARAAAIVLLLALAASTYQSLLVVYLTMAAGITLAACQRVRAPARLLAAGVVKEILLTGALLALAGLLYMALNKTVQAWSGIAPVYIGAFVHPENWRAPYWLLGSIARTAWSMYSGAPSVYGAAMPVAGAFMALAGACVLSRAPRRLALHGALLACLLGAPFVLHLLAGPDGLPMRSMLALPYVLWFLAIAVLDTRQALLAVPACALLALYQLQILNLNSQYIAAASVTQAYDRMLAADIGRQVLALRALEPTRQAVGLDVFGFRDESVRTPYASAPSAATSGSFFGWDKGNINRIAAYLAVSGLDRVTPLPAAERLAMNPQFDSMPVWPLEGSIKRVGPAILVKLGPQADLAHRAPPPSIEGHQ